VSTGDDWRGCGGGESEFLAVALGVVTASLDAAPSTPLLTALTLKLYVVPFVKLSTVYVVAVPVVDFQLAQVAPPSAD
jgi:hypothetical protein